MSYRFRRDETVGDGLRRITRHEVETTMEALGGRWNDADVHAARKSCKKLRGLLRIVRPVFPAYEEENEAIRNAAGLLAGPRDAAVLIESYDAIMQAFAGEIDRRNFGAIRRGLTTRLKAARADPALDGRVGLFVQNMQALQERMRDWTVEADGFEAFEDGVGKTLRRARNALEEARASPGDDVMHEWRKRVKYHWYHTRLLQDLFPDMMKGRRKAAKRLGSLLGDHHDLAVFAGTLSFSAEDLGSAETRDAAAALARRHQARIAAEALPLGALLFTEKPKPLVKRWHGWYELWRTEGVAA